MSKETYVMSTETSCSSQHKQHGSCVAAFMSKETFILTQKTYVMSKETYVMSKQTTRAVLLYMWTEVMCIT